MIVVMLVMLLLQVEKAEFEFAGFLKCVMPFLERTEVRRLCVGWWGDGFEGVEMGFECWVV